MLIIHLNRAHTTQPGLARGVAQSRCFTHLPLRGGDSGSLSQESRELTAGPGEQPSPQCRQLDRAARTCPEASLSVLLGIHDRVTPGRHMGRWPGKVCSPGPGDRDGWLWPQAQTEVHWAHTDSHKEPSVELIPYCKKGPRLCFFSLPTWPSVFIQNSKIKR